MRRRTLIIATLAAALAGASAHAVDEATWAYEGHDALQADQAGTVSVRVSVPDATFPAELPVAYRHFLIADAGEGQFPPVAGATIPWSRGDDSGTATTDSDGAIVVPDSPFRRGSTPALGTVAGDRHDLELTLPEGDYFLFSDLVDMTPPTSRIAGATRYATAAAASARHFPPGVEVVYVASGESFADALAAGPAAAHREAPLLLTAGGGLPQATRAELRRLEAAEIILVGGRSAVSDRVERDLAAYAGSVRRLAGIDRADTAARIARDGWPDTVPSAYVANGRSFPDALGAAARAALDDVPVLLVDVNEVPHATAQALDFLNVTTATVAGGSAVVSPTTFNALRERVGSAVRRSGADRYATSAALADRPGSGRGLLVATGQDFPDALTAGSLARRLDADLLLTRPEALPERIEQRARELAPRRVVGLGGAAALSNAVLVALDGLRTALTPLFLDPVVEGGDTALTVAEGA